MPAVNSFPWYVSLTQFVLPLPRDEGFELFLMQFSGHQIYFTTLIEYQAKQEGARPHFIATHYTDIKDSKGIVLMVGESAGESSPIQQKDAQTLLYQAQLFYVTGEKAQTDLVETFWKNPGEFDYKQLVSSVAKLA
jgi:ATP synthase mitochondrial F1 complex assembly factor 1